MLVLHSVGEYSRTEPSSLGPQPEPPPPPTCALWDQLVTWPLFQKETRKRVVLRVEVFRSG